MSSSRKTSKKPGKKFVTVDLDMTVANHGRRLHKAMVNGKIDRTVLFAREEILKDKVIAGAESALHLIRRKHRIIFLSSREKKVFGVTKQWLVANKLFKPGDRLVVVNSEREKLQHFKKLLPNLYAAIDDFKYDYQSGKPKLSNYILPQLLKLNAPVIIFDNNWRRIIRLYFTER